MQDGKSRRRRRSRSYTCTNCVAKAIIDDIQFISDNYEQKKNMEQAQVTSASSGWPALYASVLLGAVFGLLSMIAALAVAVPATLVIWITIVVLLAFFGKPRRTLVIEGRKITREIVGFVFKILLKEGNFVAAVCAILGYFALVRRNYEDD
ncbi:hypothetical protein JCGZ_25777 [Jatropha curcas]|uniref:Uncharacterized protein n=1 Tax=Jatropha curcas TaxID=180498 RepID=A0A067JVV9_JATCU|nr:uncharacterized protein LOC105646929 [Jatropha curcas]KDP24120.1 hypothetical protein JCGZ_25777 [Jatropha curcas]